MPMQAKNKNLSSTGFTLIEFMISAAISSLIFLIGATLSFNTIMMEVKQTKISQAEEDLERFIYTLKLVTSLAVNVRYSPFTNLNAKYASADGAGAITEFTYQSDVHMWGRNSVTLMYFARENRDSNFNAETTQSLYRPTGVFFVPKNEVFNANRRGSRIIIDLGAANAGGIVAPDDSDQVFENISDLILDQPQFSRSNVINSMRVNVTSIYSTISTKDGYDCLGPTFDIQGGGICNDNRTVPFKLVNKIFTIKFFNNKRDNPLSAGEFQNGVYMFKPVFGN
jgi:prepilin-type N-terminal cleavage/methylation domain-containing protein